MAYNKINYLESEYLEGAEYAASIQIFINNKFLLTITKSGNIETQNNIEIPLKPANKTQRSKYRFKPKISKNSKMAAELSAALLKDPKEFQTLIKKTNDSFNNKNGITMINIEDLNNDIILKYGQKSQVNEKKIRKGESINSSMRVKDTIGNLLKSDNINNIVKTNSFKDVKNIFKNYKVNGAVKNLYYENYDKNDVEKYCFYEHLKKVYTRISKKEIEKYKKDDVSIQEIIDFCGKYKIPLHLRNAAGETIHKNEYEKNKNHHKMSAIIANNHFYPCSSKITDYPKIKTNEDKNENLGLSTILKKGKNFYSEYGIRYAEGLEQKLETSFFKKMGNSWKYEKDESKIKSLNYIDVNSNECLFEYDLNKAFFNVCYNIDDSEQCPIFTPFDLWEKIKVKIDGSINTVCYYSISKKGLEKIKKYGFQNSIISGYELSALLEHNLIKKKYIEYIKVPSYFKSWYIVKEILIQTIKNYLINEYKLSKKDIEEKEEKFFEENKEAHIAHFYLQMAKEYNFEDVFKFYNGCLGKERTEPNKTTIYNLNKDDYELLNINLEDEKWGCEEANKDIIEDMRKENNIDFKDLQNDELYIYSKNEEYSTYRYLNNIPVYNMIIAKTNCCLLNLIMDIYENNNNIMPVKIKTDALGYNQEVKINNSFHYYLKCITEQPTKYNKNIRIKKEKPKFYKYDLKQNYIDMEEMIAEIKKEYEVLKNINVSYTGPPGTGKTYTIKKGIKDGLYSVDECSTMTNLCCSNISTEEKEAQTIYKLLMLFDPDRWQDVFKKLKNKTLWIDEFSMIPRYIYNLLFCLSIKYNCKFIITGDINQCAPVNETKINVDNDAFNSFMGNKTELKKDFRNDKEIIQLRNFILNNDKKELFTYFKKNDHSQNDFEWWKIDRHLTHTNSTRHNINKIIREKRKYIFKFKKEEGENYILNKCFVSNGYLLSARKNNKKLGYEKNSIYKVIDQEEKKVEVKINDLILFLDGINYTLENQTNKKIIYLNCFQMDEFQSGFATTTYSAQGLTIDEEVIIHDVQKMINMGITDVLYTAVTRAKEYKKLYFFYKNDFKKIEFEYGLCKIAEDEFEQYDKIEQFKIN